MSEAKDQQQQPAYLNPRGLYWRSVSALLLFQAIGWGCAAGLAYLILSPELAKDYFSAHRTVKATWSLVVPALAVSAGVGFLVVGAGSALSIWSHSRRVLEPLQLIDGLLRGMAEGRLPRLDPAAKTPDAEAEVAATLEPFRARVQDVQRISRDLQKISLEFNYKSAGTEEVTLKDLRGLANRLDALSKDLARASGWFEG
jgi:methyl-accepting chemotaxis protein